MRTHMRETGRIHPVSEALRLQARYLVVTPTSPSVGNAYHDHTHYGYAYHGCTYSPTGCRVLLVAMLPSYHPLLLTYCRVSSTSGG